ncbi:MAG: hypothetical protein KIT22_00625 [Verrucomicrobiae bacterium]|nr:hypothetical protein [Verrucomicrobiae bacterium]
MQQPFIQQRREFVRQRRGFAFVLKRGHGGGHSLPALAAEFRADPGLGLQDGGAMQPAGQRLMTGEARGLAGESHGRFA